jgi:hypothetical protein
MLFKHIQFYAKVCILIFLSSEKRCVWEVKQRDKNSLRTAEMKSLRRTTRYTLFDHNGNEEILEVLHITSLQKKVYKNYLTLSPCRNVRAYYLISVSLSAMLSLCGL